ncbi:MULTISPECIES: cytochrome-c oxidase, cbb3-type subunit II [Lysobacteraceae]|uniref:cytochrome-c oxidase, cbb3-type subunit II n=1 Tax=Lysobacteraceae TaxID=32033 RepID=UPI001BCE7E88|nr:MULTISPECIES: cytochrome-c oxidase, cbb3-type subunit II [Lysobacter]
MKYRHIETVEKHAGLLGVLIAIMVSFGGLAEITPLFIKANSIKPSPGVKPYDALRLVGRDIYVREGCYTCHSQMIRTLRFETQRYGEYSTLGDSVYDRPFQWGSKRTGPDLARIGGKYSDAWHRVHLEAPRSVVPQSNMPDYPWLSHTYINGEEVQARMRVLRTLGDPYTDAQIAGAPDMVLHKTELDAVVAYLQGLGVHPASGSGIAAKAP